MKRAAWKSHIGFMWAAIGSAIGLGSIWRFPYIVGANGGAAFVIVFVLCLFLVSLPVLIAEVLIGRSCQSSPYGSFQTLGKGKWGLTGKMTIITGFIVSSFYSVIAGWTLGYLIEALKGHLTHFTSASEAANYFSSLTSSPYWAVGMHLLFFSIAIAILYAGVQKGIELANSYLMPLLFLLLFILAIKGLMLTGAQKGVEFLFSPDFHKLNRSSVIMALGQAFFGLSLGQGTMVTYGSYLSKRENIPFTCFPIAISVVVISLLAGLAIFPVVFSVGLEPTAGSSLLFQTLPIVFSRLNGGWFFCPAFFLLVFLAALTSQISALEPSIAYLIDEKKLSRKTAAVFSGLGAFLLGIPSALSFGIFQWFKIWDMNFFDLISNFSINVLIPLGGLSATILVGWKWKKGHALDHLQEGAFESFKKLPWLKPYFVFGVKFIAPIVIIIILFNLLGVIR